MASGFLTGALAGAAGTTAPNGATVTLKLLGISDPATWTKQDWFSNVLPRLADGVVTHATMAAARS